MAIEVANTVERARRVSTDPRVPALLRRRRSITAQDRMFFTERLSLLLETGSPLHASLDILSRQAVTPQLRATAERLREDVASGATFSQALSRHPDAFSTTYVNLVGASEQGGFMADVLAQITRMEEKAAELRATLVSAFSYPGFLVVFSLAVIVFVLTFVFPKFGEMFRSIRDQLPLSTLILMTASDVLRQHWLPIIVGAAGGGFALHRWLTGASGGLAFDRLKLRVPVLRDIFVELYLTQAMRVMGLSLGHGVSVPDALRACRDVVRNRAFRDLMNEVDADVQEGRGVARAFERSRFVPTLAKQMIATGEETGNLPLVMTRLADFYERELTRRLERMAKLVEPMMLLVMGAVVGLIVASLILPIFKLSRAAGA